MGINTFYKIMTIGLLMNLMFGMISASNDGGKVGIEKFMDKFSELSTNSKSDTDSISSGYKSESNTQTASSSANNNEGTFGSAIGWFQTIWTILPRAIDPFSLKAPQSVSDIEQVMYDAVAIFRLIFLVITLLAIYNFVKNKST